VAPPNRHDLEWHHSGVILGYGENFDAELADAIGLHLELSQRALVLTSQRAAVLDELDQCLSPGSIPSNAEVRQRA
jgi:hypothetical protein